MRPGRRQVKKEQNYWGHSSLAEERGAKHSPLTLEAILKGNNVLGVEHVDI